MFDTYDEKVGSQSFRLTNLIYLFFRSSSFGKENTVVLSSPIYLSDSSPYNFYKLSSIKQYDTISLMYILFSNLYFRLHNLI